MEKHPETPGNFERALQLAGMGYRLIPVRPGTKTPALRWKQYQDRAPTEEELWQWFDGTDYNVGFVTGNGLVVIDCDSMEVVDRVIEHCGDTPQKSKTPRGGVHLHYRMRKGVRYGNAVEIRGEPLDMRCEGGLAVEPWSRSAEGTPYEWLGPVLPVNELPVIRISHLRERTRKVARVSLEPVVEPDRAALVRRARAYLAHVEGAVSGQRGHDRTFRAACILAVKFGLSFEEAWPIFWEWNEAQCEPPWSERELAHKLSDAIAKR